MTADQQLNSFGISADANRGEVIIQTRGSCTILALEEVRRFRVWFERAIADATRQVARGEEA